MAYEPDTYICRKCPAVASAIVFQGAKQKPFGWSQVTLFMNPICNGYLCYGCTQKVLAFVFP